MRRCFTCLLHWPRAAFVLHPFDCTIPNYSLAVDSYSYLI